LMGLAKGMSSVSYIGLLMFLLFYVFGIISLLFFRANDPAHFPDLHATFITLFRCATMEDWTDVMYVSMYGCAKYHYGFSDDELAKCENSKGYGMVAAMYWILFIMLSSLVMLNLVVGVVCSAMAQATEDDKNLKKKLAMMERVARETRIPRAVLDAWESGFQELDDSEGYGSGNIRREDLSLLLTILGEVDLLSRSSREHLFVRANHTYPLGMISMDDFVEVLAKDLASRSKQARTRQRRIDLWSNQLVEKEGELSSADAGAAQVLQTEIQALKDKIERQKLKIAADKRTQAETEKLEAEEEERRSLSGDRTSGDDTFSNPLARVDDSLTIVT